jgi:hypothetical protein
LSAHRRTFRSSCQPASSAFIVTKKHHLREDYPARSVFL